MNKKFLVLAAAALGLTFASCKKDYTCTCRQALNGVAFDTVTQTFSDYSKNDIEKACPESGTTSSGGFSLTTNCTYEKN